MTVHLLYSPTAPDVPALATAATMTGGLLIVGGWIYLAAQFSDTEWLVEDGRIYLVVSPVALIVLLAWVNALAPTVNALSWLSRPDLLVSAYTATSYGLVALSLLILSVHFYRVEGIYRRQTAFLIVAPLAPWITAVVYQFDFVPIPAELTPVGYVPTLLLTLYALHKHDLLDIVPIARQTVLNNIEDTVISVSANDVVASVNDPGKELLGLDNDVVGEDLTTALAEWPSILSALEEGEGQRVTIDGKHLRVVVTPIERNGTEYGSVIHLRDVTYEVRRREQLREKQAQLETKNDQLDEFASVVSHDIRNPLHVAQGHLELIADEVDSEESVETITRSHERIENIVNTLLTLAEKGQQVSETEVVDFGTVVDQARLSGAIASERVVFEGPETLRADPSRLQQLLENLFKNSVQHGGDDVTIRVGPLDSGAGFYVADDGPGIPEDDRTQVFEYGYTDSVDGTGFGLNIVKTIADAHNWHVGIVDSDTGGARFEFETGTGEDVSGRMRAPPSVD